MKKWDGILIGTINIRSIFFVRKENKRMSDKYNKFSEFTDINYIYKNDNRRYNKNKVSETVYKGC